MDTCDTWDCELWIDRSIDGYIDMQMGRYIDKLIDIQIIRKIDRQMDTCDT